MSPTDRSASAHSTAPTAPTGGGRRRANRPVEAFGLPGFVVGAVIAALTAGALVATAGAGNPAPRPETASTTSTASQRQVVCPGSPAGGAGGSSTVLAMLPGLTGVTDGAVRSDGSALSLSSPGVRIFDKPHPSPRISIATGKATGGLFGAVRRGGGAVAGCGGPQSSWWFVGAGSGPDHYSTVTLVNPRRTASVVDVTVTGTSGPVEAPGLRGIQMRSGQTIRLKLQDVAPSREPLAVHVQTSVGLVYADLLDHRVDSGDPQATPVDQWLPPQTNPSRTILLSGTPEKAAGEATLYLANDGSRESIATIEVSDDSGSFTPRGQEPVRVGAGSVLEIPWKRYAGRSIRVTGKDRLVAGLTADQQGRSLFHAAPVVPRRGVTAAAVPPGLDSAVVRVTAAEKATTGTLLQIGASGKTLSRKRVSLDAGATEGIELDRGCRQVVLRSDDALAAAVSTLDAGQVGAIPLVTLAQALQVPRVLPAG